MAGGFQGVHGHGFLSTGSVRAAGGGAPARGTPISPDACLRAAIQAGPMSAEDRARFRSELAAVKAQDDARRDPSPQGDLLEAA